jgi:hypothetical protein
MGLLASPLNQPPADGEQSPPCTLAKEGKQEPPLSQEAGTRQESRDTAKGGGRRAATNNEKQWGRPCVRATRGRAGRRKRAREGGPARHVGPGFLSLSRFFALFRVAAESEGRRIILSVRPCVVWRLNFVLRCYPALRCRGAARNGEVPLYLGHCASWMCGKQG